MNTQSIKHFLILVLGNVFRLLISVFASILIPRLLGIVDYGYYKLFALYATYFSLSHFGFSDGIYLRFGGKSANDLRKNDFRAYFKFFSITQIVLASIGVTVSLVLLKGEIKYIFSLLFISIIPTNLNNYFQLISQMTARFKEYTIRTTITSILNLLVIVLMSLFEVKDYRLYIIALIVINSVILLWYIFTYRDFIFGIPTKFIEIKSHIKEFFILGIPLLLANLASTFVLATDKQIVDWFFNIEIFSVYSFSYSMLSMITVVVSAISLVIYPILKKIQTNNIRKYYSVFNSIVISVVLIGLTAYFPLVLVIKSFLPQYTDSIIILRIALPGLLFTSSVTAIKHNFFKTTGNNPMFLILTVVTLFVNLLINLSAYYIFKDARLISASSLFGLFIWYLVTEIYMYKKYKIKWFENGLLIIVGALLFYLITIFDNIIVTGIVYLISVLFFVLLVNKKNISFFISELLPKKPTKEDIL